MRPRPGHLTVLFLEQPRVWDVIAVSVIQICVQGQVVVFY